MDQQQLIVFLFIACSLLFLLVIAMGGLLWWFRKPVFQTLKLRQLVSLGFNYVKARLIRYDNTSIDIAVKPDKDGFISFPHVNGKYLINKESVILENRIIPTFTFREGETSPINFQSEFVETLAKCPNCNDEVKFKIDKPASINAGVFEGLILRIKALGGMLDFMRENKIILICVIVTLLLLMGVAYGVYKYVPEYIVKQISSRVPSWIAEYKGSMVI